MRSFSLSCTCLGLLLAASPVLAKDKAPDKPMDHQAMMEAYAKLAAPGEPHKQLASQAGHWITKTKSWMEPDKPPMQSMGACDNTVLLEGRFLQQQCTGDMMGQPFTGIGLHGYDNATKKYVTTWIDSMGTGIFYMEGTGSADGKTVTLSGSHPDPMGGVIKHRAVWKFVDANTQIFEMYGSEARRGGEMKMMEITYTRQP